MYVCGAVSSHDWSKAEERDWQSCSASLCMGGSPPNTSAGAPLSGADQPEDAFSGSEKSTDFEAGSVCSVHLCHVCLNVMWPQLAARSCSEHLYDKAERHIMQFKMTSTGIAVM